MISNCGSDERGRARGGKAGDNNGREWRIRTWYSSPWKCVLRYPRSEVRNMISDFAKDSALNDNIGYNQADRVSFWKALTKSKYQPKNVSVKCNTDCSAGVSAIVKAVGYRLGIAKLKNINENNWTGSMRQSFREAGFEVLTGSKYLTSDKYLLPGDILLNDAKHTCINIDYGVNVNPKTKKSYTGGYPIIPPVLKFASNGLQVERLQRFLNWYGNYGLVIDGEFGKKTENAVINFQSKVFPHDPREWDGQFGAKSLAKAKASNR